MRRPQLVALVSSLIVGACHAPILNRRAVGCYEIHAPAWTASNAKEFGFVFPNRIVLDSAFAKEHPTDRRGWPWNYDGGVRWSNTAVDWLLLQGDTIVHIRGRTLFHTFGADSIRVTFWSRRDGFQAWLASTGNGYRGLAQRVNWKTGRRESVPIALERATCS